MRKNKNADLLKPKIQGNSAILYHDKLASQWSINYQKKSFKNRLNLFNKLLHEYVKKHDIWLDAGCGSGVLTEGLLELGANVVAVDGSLQMIEKGSERLSPKNSELTWINIELLEINKLEHQYFDGILCSSVIEYLNNPFEFIRDLNLLMKPGGILIISIPSKYSPIRFFHKIIRLIFRLFSIKIFEYLSVSKYEIDPCSAKELFQLNGFEFVARANYDPIFPKAFLKILSPSLLVYILKK